MNKDEALKMAILNLEVCASLMATHEYSDDFYQSVSDAIDTCKEALEQPAQDADFVFICKHCGDEIGIKWLDESKEQEPVAWQWLKSGHMRKKIPKTATPEHWRPLYTHPAQPLSDDEICKIYEDIRWDIRGTDIVIDFARAIEQALKEKNT